MLEEIQKLKDQIDEVESTIQGEVDKWIAAENEKSIAIK